MCRRTKIVATLGPATDRPGNLEQLVTAGVNVFRFNFSHGSADDHIKRAMELRALSAKHNTSVAILGDLQGPKIRIQRFENDGVDLAVGDAFTLDAALESTAGNQETVGIDYKPLPEYCHQGDILLLDDGRIRLEVQNVEGSKVNCQVIMGGYLSNNKGINRLGGGLAAPALTEKDYRDMKTAAEIGADYIAVSFPLSPDDIETARTSMQALESDARIVAKIERAETVNDKELLDSIIQASDAVMVARGDLGVEIGDGALIGIQKYLIKRARQLNRCVITATQMMESMIENPLPTRAEVFDVANAVLDGSDAVMLSAETAAGNFPVEAVKAMADTCIGAEREPSIRKSDYRINASFERIDEAIAMSTMYAANHLDGVTAVICLTESGSTPLWMSRLHSGLPIYALSRHARSRQRVSLYRGVTAIPFDSSEHQGEQVYAAALAELSGRGLVEKGDFVLLTKGSRAGVHGGTDALKILQVQ
jgi:pyruvate kinase